MGQVGGLTQGEEFAATTTPMGMGWGGGPNQALQDLVAESRGGPPSHVVRAPGQTELLVRYEQERQIWESERQQMRDYIVKYDRQMNLMHCAHQQELLTQSVQQQNQISEAILRADLMQRDADRSKQFLEGIESVLRRRLCDGLGLRVLESDMTVWSRDFDKSPETREFGAMNALAEAFVAEIEREVRASAAATPGSVSPALCLDRSTAGEGAEGSSGAAGAFKANSSKNGLLRAAAPPSDVLRDKIHESEAGVSAVAGGVLKLVGLKVGEVGKEKESLRSVCLCVSQSVCVCMCLPMSTCVCVCVCMCMCMCMCVCPCPCSCPCLLPCLDQVREPDVQQLADLKTVLKPVQGRGEGHV